MYPVEFYLKFFYMSLPSAMKISNFLKIGSNIKYKSFLNISCLLRLSAYNWTTILDLQNKNLSCLAILLLSQSFIVSYGTVSEHLW